MFNTYLCVLGTTETEELPAGPPYCESTTNPLDTCATLLGDESLGGHSDVRLAQKEWATKKREKRQHSLAVAATRAQKKRAAAGPQTRRRVQRHHY